MNKTRFGLAAVSGTVIICCCWALAVANDVPNAPPASGASVPQAQQVPSAAPPAAVEQPDRGPFIGNDNTVGRTCMNERGVMLQQGDAGYTTCIDRKRKQQEAGQIAPRDSSETKARPDDRAPVESQGDSSSY